MNRAKGVNTVTTAMLRLGGVGILRRGKMKNLYIIIMSAAILFNTITSCFGVDTYNIFFALNYLCIIMLFGFDQIVDALKKSNN